MHRAADETLSLPLGRIHLKHRPVSEQTGGISSSDARGNSHWQLPVLLLITCVGGCFRFYHLDYPALWNDETLVYWRTCGTYAQMLVPLRHDMFPPLHYSLYWLIAQYHTLTPWVFRLVPAVAGTLTIPAIYFLSRQLLSKGTSLLAAAFTACSAFMLFYSRDAKMYPHLWLFVTLNVGCLLWWFRTNKATAWLCWVAAGCAMTGLHFSALAIPALSLLFVLTQRTLHWRQTLWFLLGVALIVAGPVGFFTKFNPVADRLDVEGWKATRIGWVGGFFNGTRTGPQLVQYTSSAMLMGYEWPRDDYTPTDLREAAQPISPPLVECPQIAAAELFCILAIAALPWPLCLRPKSDPTAQPQWRLLLWLGGWILFIAYGFYIPSMEGFVSPRGWIYELEEWLPIWGVALIVAALTTFTLIAIMHRQYLPALLRFAKTGLAAAGLYIGCMVMFILMFPIVMDKGLFGQPLGSIWEPRYLGIIWPAVGIATAALLMRLPTRPVRIACIFFLLAVNLVMAGLRLALTTEPPIDLLAKDIWLSQDPGSRVRTFDFIQAGDIAVAGSNMNANSQVASGRYYLEMESNHQPISPAIFASSLSFYDRHADTRYKALQRSVDSTPRLQHVIIWTQLFPHDLSGKAQQLAYDPYRHALPNWKLADEQVYTVRIYWDWRERWKWVRREYVRRNDER